MMTYTDHNHPIAYEKHISIEEGLILGIATSVISHAQCPQSIYEHKDKDVHYPNNKKEKKI